MNSTKLEVPSASLGPVPGRVLPEQQQVVKRGIRALHDVKRKLGKVVRNKTEMARKNDEEWEKPCHNVYCLIPACSELGIEPKLLAVWFSRFQVLIPPEPQHPLAPAALGVTAHSGQRALLYAAVVIVHSITVETRSGCGGKDIAIKPARGPW